VKFNDFPMVGNATVKDPLRNDYPRRVSKWDIDRMGAESFPCILTPTVVTPQTEVTSKISLNFMIMSFRARLSQDPTRPSQAGSYSAANRSSAVC
jgi:hypothetical protein